jgi:hypothetical protein
MRFYTPYLITFSAGVLISCGGGGGGSASSPTTPPVSSGPALTVSTTSVTISGKQFGDIAPAERVNLTYDSNVVSIVSILVNGDAKFEGRNVFSAESDSSNSFADIRVDNTDIEGGTYVDQLVLQPSLRAGGFGNTVTVDLTLVQDPTQPLTVEFIDPGEGPVEVVEGGPPQRFPATINTGNTIRWEVQPYRFDADEEGVFVLTSDPAQGTGSEQVDIILTPTPALIETLRGGQSDFSILGFQDIDHLGNFTELGFEVILATE